MVWATNDYAMKAGKKMERHCKSKLALKISSEEER